MYSKAIRMVVAGKERLWRFVMPRAKDEDTRRRQFILNILLTASITLLSIAIVSSVITSFLTSAEDRTNNAIPIIFLVLELLFFIGLYVLSRRGVVTAPSTILVGIFLLCSVYFAYRWGPDVPVGLLYYSLTIVMAGVLLDSKAALLVAAFFAIYLPLINVLQSSKVVHVNYYWRQSTFMILDAMMISVVLLIIAVISWLSNREIERSLRRARNSESELKQERDMLEIRVQERTEELHTAEMERLSQAYHFVEFGRLAGGIFHDLMNPLTALSLNIDSIARSHTISNSEQVSSLGEQVAHAKSATQHMQKLIESMRKQLTKEGTNEEFSVTDTIHEIIRTLTSYAVSNGVTLKYETSEIIHTYGNSIALMQIVTNIIANAIQSFEYDEETKEIKHVTVISKVQRGTIQVLITDTGPGMSSDTVAKIFEPFFSTKSKNGGLGLGLSLTKQTVEKEFGGSIMVTSELGRGTCFTIYFPQREP